MTSVDNNIKALIASQMQQAEIRSPSASISRLDTAQIIDKKTIEQSGNAPLAAGNTTASVQVGIATSSSITDLLIRLRELAIQALYAIRPQLASQMADHSNMESMEPDLLALEASCSALVTKINLGHPNQHVFTQAEKIEALDSPRQKTEYAKTTASLARAEIEQHAGQALLAQANQRPAFVMALLH